MRIRWKRRGAITTALYKGLRFGTITTEKATKGNVYSIHFEEEEKELRLKNYTNSKATLKSWYIDWIKKTYRKLPRIPKK